jgi:hypothetical protein
MKNSGSRRCAREALFEVRGGTNGERDRGEHPVVLDQGNRQRAVEHRHGDFEQAQYYNVKVFDRLATAARQA